MVMIELAGGISMMSPNVNPSVFSILIHRGQGSKKVL
jgi:hypothetical protein